MELYQGGTTKNLLDMSVEEALALQESLANAISFALKHGSRSFTMGTVQSVNEKSFASKITFQVNHQKVS